MNNLFTLLNDGHNPFIKGAVYRPMHHYGRGGLGYHPMRMIKGGSGTSTEIVVKPKNELSIAPKTLTRQEIIDQEHQPDVTDILNYLKNEEEEKPIQKIITKAKKLKDIQRSIIPNINLTIPKKISLLKKITLPKSKATKSKATKSKATKSKATKPKDEIESIIKSVSEIKHIVIKDGNVIELSKKKYEKELETQFNERQELIREKEKELADMNAQLEKRSKELIKSTAKSIQNRYAKNMNLENIKEKYFNTINTTVEADTEINNMINDILKKQNELDVLKQGNKNLVFAPEYHERLLSGRSEIEPKSRETFESILSIEIPESSKTFDSWYKDTSIKNISHLYTGLNKQKPEYLSNENISFLAESMGISKAKVFESIDNYPDELVIKIIKTLDPSFNTKNIREIVKINTNRDYDDGVYKFKGSDWAPFDNIAIVIYNDGNTVKYTIENKYYDATSILTGEIGKSGIVTKGEHTTFEHILDYNTSRFNDYKIVITNEFNKLLVGYNNLIAQGATIDDIKEMEPELHAQYHEYLNLYKNNDALTESFYKNVYLPNIPMKLSKTNFQYKYAEYIEGSVTNADFYDYFKNDAKIVGKTRTEFNEDGTIKGIYNSQSKSLASNIGYDLFNDSKVLYVVSFSDALLGMNWTNTLSTLEENHKSFFINPLYLRHPTQSAYGAHKTPTGRLRRLTDSLALRPTDFNVLNGKL